jgi:hypothetical protein
VNPGVQPEIYYGWCTGAEIIGPDGLYLPSKNNKLNSDAVHYYLPIDFPQNFTFACNSRRKFFEENYI